MKILIATGIYPPQTSGPAQYAQKMNEIWGKLGHEVVVKKYKIEKFLPTGVRHSYYFLKIIPSVIWSEVIFALDTFSTGFPAVLAGKIFGKKVVLRTGGDFLWEGYIERTSDLVLLRDFYNTRTRKLSLKERVIFYIIKWTLNNCEKLVFSTDWQRSIFLIPYKLNQNNVEIIENHYEKCLNGDYTLNNTANKKVFIGGSRNLKWKNLDFLRSIFKENEILEMGAELDLTNETHDNFLKKIKESYAVILISLGDISPHLIIDTISIGKPFIITEENGIMNRVKEVAITVNPKDKIDIINKVKFLLNEGQYLKQVEKIKNFSFKRSWQNVAEDYLSIFNKLS